MAKQVQLFQQQIQDLVGREVLQTSALIEVPPGKSLFQKGERCTQFLLVVAGSVKVYGETPAGREVVLYHMGAGESCVLTTSCLLGDRHYPAHARTETLVQTLAIPRPAFMKGLAESDDFRMMVFASYGERLASLVGLIQELTFERVDVRLARYLLDHQHANRLLLSHQQLALALDSSEEVILRLLKEFEQRGWLLLHRGGIDIVQAKKLNFYIAEATA
ncbi:Crp/Fnr family transcriptional regulator [Pokkaliibacter plantistimulans]|uniref:Crp/Fnr family transcriptional regulator n=1 Tax=Pokkaliibacter plantistimulans TaxID=1635171 RepID=UPI000D74F3EE|nr:Crp/Fnr family transcriptional regulator [Pokkaliibacter plantistimulans]